jgi:hypothetical protein
MATLMMSSDGKIVPKISPKANIASLLKYEQIYKIVKSIFAPIVNRSQNNCQLSERAEEDQKEAKEAVL